MAETSVPEVWLPVTGWPYEVSNLGRVRPTKWSRSNPNQRPLKPEIDKYGYTVYTLMHEGKKWHCKVHRLICESWHGPPPFEGAQARHLNDDKTDNNPDNLFWGSASDNQTDKYTNDLVRFGELHHRAIHTTDVVQQVRADYAQAEFEAHKLGRKRLQNGALSALASKYGMSRNQIINLVYLDKISYTPSTLGKRRKKKGRK